jgi:hypothetical protein
LKSINIMKDFTPYEPSTNFSELKDDKDNKDDETSKNIEEFRGNGGGRRGGRGGRRGGRGGRRGGGGGRRMGGGGRRFWRRVNRYRRGGVQPSYNYLYRTPYYYYDYPSPWYYNIPYVFGNSYYEMPNDAYFVGGQEENSKIEKGQEEIFDIGSLLKGNTFLIILLVVVIAYLYSKKK